MAGNKHTHHEHETHVAPELQGHPIHRHEESDVDVWAIGKFAIGLILLCIFSIGIIVGMFEYLLKREGGIAPTRVEGVSQDARQLPPEPRLEETPVSDLQEMRAAEDKILNTYGWVDESNGIVRVPIARAIDLLAERGLPSRPRRTAVRGQRREPAAGKRTRPQSAASGRAGGSGQIMLRRFIIGLAVAALGVPIPAVAQPGQPAPMQPTTACRTAT